jgi:Fe-S-cluster-containing dehydrogenase component
MINFDYMDRPNTIATAAFVCFHCDDPTCAQVCPADAIKKGEDGVVQSALKPRCIGCSNCVLACPFGIPKLVPESPRRSRTTRGRGRGGGPLLRCLRESQADSLASVLVFHVPHGLDQLRFIGD